MLDRPVDRCQERQAETSVLLLVPANCVVDGTDVLAGVKLGGVPVVTALSLASGLPAAFVRNEAKSYGTASLAEGADVIGNQVLIVEDVITTGGQVGLSTADLRSVGAVVDAALCVIDRSDGDHTRLEAIDLDVTALFRSDDVAN